MTIVTLRPNFLNDFFGSPFPLGTGTTVDGSTSDNSDSSYVRAGSDRTYVGLRCTDLSPLAATQRVRSCTLRARTGADSVSGFQATSLSLTALDLHVTPVANFAITRGLTSIITTTGPTSYFGPGGKQWTQSSVNAIRLGVQWHKVPTGGTAYQRVYELYVDVDITNQPTVTGAPTVTNFTGSAQPTVAWVYADLDGDAQSAWALKIFSAASYGDPLFNPDSSTPSYYGTGSNTTSSTAINAFLQNGTTYQAYIQVAKRYPSPTTGAPWWSAWAVSAPFTVTLSPPPTPTLAVTPLLDGNNARALITVDAPVNMLGMDMASFTNSIATWTVNSNCTITRSTTDAADGLASLQMTSVAAGDMMARSGLDADGNPWIDYGGDTFTAVASFHAAVSARSCQVGIIWQDVAGATISTVFGASVTDSAGAGVYTQAFYTGVAPGNAVQAQVIVKVLATGAANEIHRVDKVSIVRGTGTVWSAGGYSSSQAVVTERGERVDTARGPAMNWAHPQVASGGSVERDNGAGFFVDRAKDLIAWRYLDKTLPGPNNPAGMIQWQPRTASVTTLRIGAAWFYPEWDWNFPILCGLGHVFSCWAWVKSGTFATTPRVEWLADQPLSGSIVSTTAGTPVTLTTTPQRLIFTATAPVSGVSGARVTLSNDASVNTSDVYVTKIGWGLGTDPLDDRAARGGPLVWIPTRDYLEQSSPGNDPYRKRQTSDFECPPGRPVVYRTHVTALATDGVTVLSSGWPPYVTAMVPAPPVPLLRSIPDPQQSVAVNRRHMSSLSGRASMAFDYVEDATVYHPLGRNGGPVKIRDWIGGEDGELLLVTISEAQNSRLRNLILTSAVCQIQWAQGGRSYILITDRPFTEELHYFPWCDVDSNTVSPYIRYDAYSLRYIETTAP